MKPSAALCTAFISAIIILPLITAGFTQASTSTSAPGLLWSRYQSFPARADNSSCQWSQPAVADGVVYVGSISTINFGLPIPIPNGPPYDPNNDWSDFYALNASNGAIIWDHFDPSATYFVGAPVVSDGRVIYCKGPFADANPTVIALSASTGKMLWNYSFDGELSSPIVSGGLVYVASTGGFNHSAVYALNETDGTLVWRAPGYGRWQLQVANGIVYIGLADCYYNGEPAVYALNALDATSGKFLWNFTTQWWPSQATVVRGIVYFCADYNIYALNAFTGTKIWNYTTPPVAINKNTIYDTENMSPVVKNGILYVFSSRAGTLLALKVTNGAQLWNSTGRLSSPNWGDHTTVVDGIVYLSFRGVSAINAFSGREIWETKFSYYNSPLVANNVAYYAVTNGPFNAQKLPDVSSEQIKQQNMPLPDDGSNINIKITRGLTSEVFHGYLTSDGASKTYLFLTVSGKSGQGLSNITVSRNSVGYGSSPTVYIDDQKAATQGYSQDTDNYYVWYNAYSNQYELSIVFANEHEVQNQLPVEYSTIAIAGIIIAAVVIVSVWIYFKRKRV